MKASLSLFLFGLLGLFGVSSVRADDRVMQFIIDPFNPDQAWMLTDQNLQFNPNLKAQGQWEIRFDKSTFSKVTGLDGGAGYRHKKIQASKGKAGHLYLLVENTDAFGADKKLFIFATGDYGESWKYTMMGGRRAPPPARVARKRVEEGGGGTGGAGGGGAVDLNSLGDSNDSTGASKGGTDANAPHVGPAAGGSQPIFKILFDLLLTLRPGITPWTFDNYHTFLLADVIPRPEIHFMFEVNPSPKFYELDYQLSNRATLRAGRIFIPFDEMDPHNTFGGRFNTSLLAQPGAPAFLPDLWTDLGLGLKYQLVDSKDLSVVTHFTLTNGFQEGGTDPVGEVGNHYPNFGPGTIPNPDNNFDKAFNFRIHLDLFNTLGLGFSFYECRYTKDNAGEPDRRIFMVGLDGQLRMTTGTEISFGYVYMNVGLPPPATQAEFLRGGLYADIGQRLGDRWKLVLRGGTSQNDNRVSQISDQELIGARLIYDLSLFKFSFETYHDLNPVPGKVNYDFAALRALVLF